MLKWNGESSRGPTSAAVFDRSSNRWSPIRMTPSSTCTCSRISSPSAGAIRLHPADGDNFVALASTGARLSAALLGLALRGDNTEPLLIQTDRDWIWFAAWGRYAWNPKRDPALEQTYWSEQFARRFAIPGGVNAQGHSSEVVGLESFRQSPRRKASRQPNRCRPERICSQPTNSQVNALPK